MSTATTYKLCPFGCGSEQKACASVTGALDLWGCGTYQEFCDSYAAFDEVQSTYCLRLIADRRAGRLAEIVKVYMECHASVAEGIRGRACGCDTCKSAREVLAI